MFHFGFSYVGLIYLLMLIGPNLLWVKDKPEGFGQQKENILLRILEKIGQAGVCLCLLIFSDFNIRTDSIWWVWLALSFACMVVYEGYWLRYFKSEKKMSDFYRPVLGIPIPGAVLPVAAFFLLGIYGCNAFLMLFTLAFGIGHIGIHLGHRRALLGQGKKRKLLPCIGKAVLLGLLGVLAAVAIVVAGGKNGNYIRSYIDPDKGVNEGIYVTLGGQEQYLLIRGENRENPVIIWLHGGPASPDAFTNYLFQIELAQEYTVINWDQRGCGRTYYRNARQDPDNETASFAQAQADLDELVDYACQRFQQDKVILVGHSYGTMLGSQYVLAHPEKVEAYIGVGQVVSVQSDLYSYQDALQKATALGDDTSEMEEAYQQYLADPSLINMINLRNYTVKYHMAEKSANTIWAGIVSPYMGMEDVRWFLSQIGSYEKYTAFLTLNDQLFDYIMEADVRSYGLEYQVPAGFITGSDDWTTPAKFAQDYYESIHAPQKQFALVPGCGHSPQYDSPEEFCQILRDMLNELRA